MIELPTFAFVVLAACLLSYFFARRQFQHAILKLDVLHSENSNAAIENYKSSEDFANLLLLEHAKGKQAGAADELAKFHITYTPVLIDDESYFFHKVDVGYEMQLHYAGFPIGDPTRRITHHQQKSKDENITKVLEVVGQTLELAAAVVTKQRIPVTVSKSPKRVPNK